MRYSCTSNGRSNNPADVSSYRETGGARARHQTLRRQPRPQRRERPRAVHQIPQHQRRPPAADRRQRHLHRAVRRRPVPALRPRHVYAHDGIALLIVDWTIGDVHGTATDVAREGADGRWRYVIDNPFGVSQAVPSRRS
ncbi:hypothetical protein SK571_39175 [Lentzea sp. BCCO 10_0798]|uniref:Uncharacterized protein n=1 Tax=Lentzea kristufekii TaxID=3095430 RepID=A0ABU4U4D0_9PSEU|nr:hypothetical protein [Lentzea sp. BCCO 10_0798]MDX8055433.1 hypothetical protein [Lentzea sp. BCCO 10_0798]